jgi:hypothetical protein
MIAEAGGAWVVVTDLKVGHYERREGPRKAPVAKYAQGKRVRDNKFG